MAAGVRCGEVTLRAKRDAIREAVHTNREAVLRGLLVDSVDKKELYAMSRKDLVVAAAIFIKELDNLCTAAKFREAAIVGGQLKEPKDNTPT